MGKLLYRQRQPNGPACRQAGRGWPVHPNKGGEMVWYYIIAIIVGGVTVALVGAVVVILAILAAADQQILDND